MRFCRLSVFWNKSVATFFSILERCRLSPKNLWKASVYDNIAEVNFLDVTLNLIAAKHNSHKEAMTFTVMNAIYAIA